MEVPTIDHASHKQNAVSVSDAKAIPLGLVCHLATTMAAAKVKYNNWDECCLWIKKFMSTYLDEGEKLYLRTLTTSLQSSNNLKIININYDNNDFQSFSYFFKL